MITPIETLLAMERAVIACAMLYDKAAREVAAALRARDFIIEAHRDIFVAVCALIRDGKPVDFLTVSESVRNSENLKRIGGLDYIINISESMPSGAVYEQYVEAVRDNGREYRISKMLDVIATTDEPMIPQLRRLIEEEEQEPESKGQTETFKRMSAYMDDLCGGIKPETFSLGLPKLDNDLGGLPKESVSVLAARPKIGKTALALNFMAYNIIHNKKKCAFFSLEMTVNQLTDRLISAEAKIPYECIRDRRLTADQQGAACDKILEMLGSDRLNLYDNLRNIGAIGREIARIKPDLVFIDYIQRVKPEEKRLKRNEEIEAVMDAAKGLALSHNCHIMLLSQINREGADKPRLEHLKESGAIEEGGDIVFLLHRPEENDILKQSGDLIVAKHKYGREGVASLNFKGGYQRFTEAAKEDRYVGNQANREPGEE